MKTLPVEKLLRSEARNSTICATSCGAAVPAERDDAVEELGAVLADDLGEPLLDPGLELVLDGAGGEHVHPDVARRRLFGHHAGQPDEGVLGGGVGAHARVGAGAHDARGDDDAAPVVHERQPVLAGEERAPDVRGDDGVEDVLGILGDRLDDARDAGVAEDDVDVAPVRDRPVEVLPGLRGVGDVGGDAVEHVGPRVQRGGRPGELLRRPADQQHPRPLFQQRLRGRQADAASAAGDDAHLPVHDPHVLPLRSRRASSVENPLEHPAPRYRR